MMVYVANLRLELAPKCEHPDSAIQRAHPAINIQAKTQNASAAPLRLPLLDTCVEFWNGRTLAERRFRTANTTLCVGTIALLHVERRPPHDPISGP